MNRRGVIDKAILAMPIFFAVVVILVLFGLLSAGVFGFKKLSERDAELSSLNMPILFEEVRINGTSMTVLEAFRNTSASPMTRRELLDNIADMTPNDGCLIFSWIDWNLDTSSSDGSLYIDPSTMPYGFYSYAKNGAVIVVTNGGDGEVSFFKRYHMYSDAKMLQRARLKFTEDNADLTFATYTGRCLDE